MADLTAKRTLVKSPPEIWTELSELEGLARHLGAFGEIRITKVEPEKTVAWEGEHARGTVELEASGWGTKVTLTAAVTEPDPEPVEPPREPASNAAPGDRPAARERQLPPSSPVLGTDTESVPPRWEPARPRGRRGFLARLFGRPSAHEPHPPAMRQAPDPPSAQPPRHTSPTPEGLKAGATMPPAEPVVVREPPLEENPEPQPGTQTVAPDAGSRPPAALDSDHALAVLESVLDNLGSAHHRPFSRE